LFCERKTIASRGTPLNQVLYIRAMNLNFRLLTYLFIAVVLVFALQYLDETLTFPYHSTASIIVSFFLLVPLLIDSLNYFLIGVCKRTPLRSFDLFYLRNRQVTKEEGWMGLLSFSFTTVPAIFGIGMMAYFETEIIEAEKAVHETEQRIEQMNAETDV
jgi:hypothetical protein